MNASTNNLSIVRILQAIVFEGVTLFFGKTRRFGRIHPDTSLSKIDYESKNPRKKSIKFMLGFKKYFFCLEDPFPQNVQFFECLLVEWLSLKR